jgi:SNF2 family DNA or RNA helicase
MTHVMDILEEYFKLKEDYIKYLRLDGTTKVIKKYIKK